MTLKSLPEARDRAEASIRGYMEDLPTISLRVAAKDKYLRVLEEIDHAVETFLPLDNSEWPLENSEIEITARSTIHSIGAIRQGTLDLNLIDHDRRVVKTVDYKRVGFLPVEKELTYLRGPQPWMYTQVARSAFPGYDVTFAFRFLIGGQKEPAVKEVFTTFTDEELDHHEAALDHRLESINRSNESGVWPQKVGSCFKYGRTCEFAKECHNGPVLLPPLNQPIISQSMVTTYDDCDRRYYYTVRDAESAGMDYHEGGETSIWAVLGTMFHLGMAEVYRVAKEEAESVELL